MVRKALVLLLGLGLLSACRKETIDLTGEPVDTTVVYALIDPADTVHTFLVFKSVLKDGVPVDEMLSDAQAVFPPSLGVEIVQGNRVWQAQRDSLPVPFFQLPYRIVYRVRASLTPGEPYVVRIREGDRIVARVNPTPIGRWTFLYPSPVDTITKIGWVSLKGQRLVWYHPKGAAAYALEMLLYYQERINGVWKSRVASIELEDLWRPERISGSGQVIWQIKLRDLLQRISASLPPAQDSIERRRLIKIAFRPWAVTEEFMTYRRSQQAVSASVASGQVLPIWTNVEGGLGLVTTRYHLYLGRYELDAQSLDSLACSDLTHHLGFEPNPSYPTYPFCQ